MHKIITQSPIIALRALIHFFSCWALLGAASLLFRASSPPATLEEAFAFRGSFGDCTSHILTALLLLIGFSYVLHRCVKEAAGAREN